MLRRSEVPRPPSTRAFRADLAAPGALEALPEAELVFYTAAADERSDAAYDRAYVTGVARLVERLARMPAPPRRLLFTLEHRGLRRSRTASGWTRRRRPSRLTSRGRRLLEGEALALAAPFPGTVLRLGGLYGPGRTSLVERARRGTAHGLARLHQPHPPRRRGRRARASGGAARRRGLLSRRGLGARARGGGARVARARASAWREPRDGRARSRPARARAAASAARTRVSSPRASASATPRIGRATKRCSHERDA